MSDLTDRQAQILSLIRDFIADSGYPPTRAEIARLLGFRSANAAEDHLKALARKGYLELSPGASRGIQLKQPAGIPVVGRVAAGSPILAQQHIENHYRLDPGLFKPRADYLLRVQGLSMRDAGILDGDLLAVHRTPEVANGQIVVARLHDEVTVKRFRRHGSVVELLPENPDFAPLIVDLEKEPLEIEGLVVGLLRNGEPL